MIVKAMPAYPLEIDRMHAVTWSKKNVLGLLHFPVFASEARFE